MANWRTKSAFGSLGSSSVPLLVLVFALIVPIYEPTLQIRYMADDFAWASLPYRVNDPATLAAELVTPRAQGTVRVFGDRALFLLGPRFATRSVLGERWIVTITFLLLIGSLY
ncbi:MAG: hypothetical protein FJW30_24530 [Acidobacteria bacterium]|nr:hypothetical protein [Acidobacteriota bacterium]